MVPGSSCEVLCLGKSGKEVPLIFPLLQRMTPKVSIKRKMIWVPQNVPGTQNQGPSGAWAAPTSISQRRLTGKLDPKGLSTQGRSLGSGPVIIDARAAVAQVACRGSNYWHSFRLQPNLSTPPNKNFYLKSQNKFIIFITFFNSCDIRMLSTVIHRRILNLLYVYR